MDNSGVQKLYTSRAAFYHFLFLDFLGVGRKMEDFLRKGNYIQPHSKILDAGCGTGNVTRTLYTIANKKEYRDVIFHAFDLTQAMLDLFRKWIKKVGARNITLKKVSVLELEQLPLDWNGYNFIVSSAMLEYLPKDKIRQALSGLRLLLNHDGHLLVFITKYNVFTKFFIKWWWEANIYSEQDLREIFLDAGFSNLKITTLLMNSVFAIEAERQSRT